MNDEIETVKATITNGSRMHLIGFYSTAKEHMPFEQKCDILKGFI